LGDIAEIFDGPHATPKKIDDGPWYLSISSLIDGRLDLSLSAHISKNDYKIWTKRVIPKAGDIVFSYETRIGQAAIISDEMQCALGRRMGLLRLNKEMIDPEYAIYAYLGPEFQETIRIHTIHGSTVNRILLTEMGKFPIMIPPFPEQRKIAAILSTWDKAIAKTEQLIAALQARKKGLMQRLLTGEVRFPGCDGEWKPRKLGELVKPIARKEAIDPEKEYAFLGVKLYVAGAHIHETVPGRKIATSSLSRIEQNDIVYNKMWVRKNAFAIAQKEHHGAYSSTEYPQFVANPEKLVTNYLGFLFHNQRFQYDAQRLCRGTTGRARLNPSDFLEIEVCIPKIGEQQKVADFLETCENEINLQNQKLVALQQQKKGLMQRLLTGQVRVKVN
ncbi:restriction endonuclease subunit S, partial [Chloroflexota bacterium]